MRKRIFAVTKLRAVCVKENPSDRLILNYYKKTAIQRSKLQFFKRCRKLFRKRRDDIHSFSGRWMIKRQAISVQHEPWNMDRHLDVRRVNHIAEQRMADGLHMNANLMRPARQQIIHRGAGGVHRGGMHHPLIWKVK